MEAPLLDDVLDCRQVVAVNAVDQDLHRQVAVCGSADIQYPPHATHVLRPRRRNFHHLPHLVDEKGEDGPIMSDCGSLEKAHEAFAVVCSQDLGGYSVLS